MVNGSGELAISHVECSDRKFNFDNRYIKNIILLLSKRPLCQNKVFLLLSLFLFYYPRYPVATSPKKWMLMLQVNSIIKCRNQIKEQTVPLWLIHLFLPILMSCHILLRPRKTYSCSFTGNM